MLREVGLDLVKFVPFVKSVVPAFQQGMVILELELQLIGVKRGVKCFSIVVLESFILRGTKNRKQ